MSRLVAESIEEVAPLASAALRVEVPRQERVHRRHAQLRAARAPDPQIGIDEEAGERERHCAVRRFEDVNRLRQVGLRVAHREELVEHGHADDLEDGRRDLDEVEPCDMMGGSKLMLMVLRGSFSSRRFGSWGS